MSCLIHGPECQVDHGGVHNTHCCRDHGCKYGDADCPVVLRKLPGIRCEMCDRDDEDLRGLLEQMNCRGMELTDAEHKLAQALEAVIFERRMRKERAK